MIAVEFLQSWDLYGPGEVAGFPDEIAAKLLSASRPPGLGDSPKPIARRFDPATALSAVKAAAAPPEPPMRVVTFTAQCGPYAAGESAGFPEPIARVYVEGGTWEGARRPSVARYVAPSPPPEPVIAFESGEPADAAEPEEPEADVDEPKATAGRPAPRRGMRPGKRGMVERADIEK